MTDFSPYLGVWTGSDALGRQVFTLTWSADGETIQGRWMMDFSSIPQSEEARAAGRPTRIEAVLGDVTIEDDVLLFRQKGVPFTSEFRLDADGTAVMGAALHKLPEAFQEPEFLRSLEGHRVRYTRME